MQKMKRWQEEIDRLEEDIRKRDNLIDEIEKDCQQLSEDIIDKICKRVWKRANKLYSDEDCFMDEITIKYAFRGYSMNEINPHLEDYFMSEIENECDKLSETEKHILAYSACSIGLSVNMDEIYRRIYNYFLGMIDEYSHTKKMQQMS